MNFRNLIPSYKTQLNSDYVFTFTVFTPAYNAGNTIDRVHSSLLKQTFKDFEWLIINDGSTDQTHKIITGIIENSPLNVNYVHKLHNQHKMACFMEAVKLAKGKFFLTFDADDECISEALQIFNDEYISIPSHLKPKISAITGLCVDQHGKLIGKEFPSDPFFSNTFESNAIANITGEKWGFTKTNVLRGVEYKDEFVKNGFMQEGIIWNLLAKKGFITKYTNKVVRIYYLNVKDSISSAPKENTALGSVIQSIVNFNWFFKDYFFKSPLFFLKNLYFLLRSSTYLHYNLNNYLSSIDSAVVKFFFVLLWRFRKFFK